MSKRSIQENNLVSFLLLQATTTIFSRVFRKTWLLVPLLLMVTVSVVRAQDVINQEEPTPASVDEVITPMDRSFIERIPRPGFFPWLKEELKDTPPFFRDTKFDPNFRNFYFRRDQFDSSISEAWAQGGALAYKSGWLLDRLKIGTTFYWSADLHAPTDRDGTLLLKPGQQSYSVLGQLYGQVRAFEDHIFNLYRYEYNTPYIGKNDSRMTPNTFEGYTLTGAFGGKDNTPGFNYGIGYITKIKERNSDEFVSMSQDAGATVKRGVAVGGGRFTNGKFSLGAIDYYSDDIINIFYAESKYSFPITEEIGALLALQFTDQRSVGDDLLKGRSFEGDQVGVRGDVSYRRGVFSLGYTNSFQEEDMQSPWSGYPGFTSVQVQDFNRAEEEAVIVKMSYDFSGLGFEGVSAYALFVHGWGRVDPSTKVGVPDENEFNADLQWRPTRSSLNGLSVRFRYSRVEQYQGTEDNLEDFRVIINYDFSLL